MRGRRTTDPGRPPARLLGGALLGWLLAGGAPAEAQERPGQARALLPDGVTREIELAIERGLGYVVKAQAPDGSWAGETGAYPVAMTALAGLSLLASGSTASRGPYAPSIQSAAGFLLETSSDTGLFTARFRSEGFQRRYYEQRSMFGHAFTMLFLAQVLGEEGSLDRRQEIQDALRKAVDLAIRSQSGGGGWYYYPDSGDDEGTLTVTVLQGLRACRDAGVHVPKQVIDRGVKYIDASVSPSGAVYYSRTSRRTQIRHGVTCAAAVALWCAGRYDDPNLKRIVTYMDQNITPKWNTGTYGTESHYTYVQFYHAQARHFLGGDRWSRFYKAESRLLLAAQNDDGSWVTDEEMDQHGVGAIYSTSIALIVLQLPYNRLPIFQR